MSHMIYISNFKRNTTTPINTTTGVQFDNASNPNPSTKIIRDSSSPQWKKRLVKGLTLCT